MISSDFLWTEKFRPKTIDDTILPDELKAVFNQFIKQQNIPNLLLTGSSGVGKTTVARALLEQLGCDYIMINGSLDRNIDTLRNEIQNFASTVSFTGGRKYVILDEADFLNSNSTQPALRNFMEEFSRNCGFILTCNFKNKIIPAIHSRCSVIDFNVSKKETVKLASQFMKRIFMILETENISYDKPVIVELINKYFPDYRRILNELQRYSATGKIDTGILTNLRETNIKELIYLMKDKNFSEIRKWVKNNSDSDVTSLYNEFYEMASEYFTKPSVPQLILHIATYQYQNAFVANTEINFVAFLIMVMKDCEFV